MLVTVTGFCWWLYVVINGWLVYILLVGRCPLGLSQLCESWSVHQRWLLEVGLFMLYLQLVCFMFRKITNIVMIAGPRAPPVMDI